jgi:hypothetical protein
MIEVEHIGGQETARRQGGQEELIDPGLHALAHRDGRARPGMAGQDHPSAQLVRPEGHVGDIEHRIAHLTFGHRDGHGRGLRQHRLHLGMLEECVALPASEHVQASLHDLGEDGRIPVESIHADEAGVVRQVPSVQIAPHYL